GHLSLRVSPQALAIYERQVWREHPFTANSLYNLAQLYQTQGRYSEAKPLLQQALGIYTRTFRPHHPLTKTIQQYYDGFLEENQHMRN
ncbi:MAG: tetratricopeptide repeat protein, partial [Ktedonobacteraceae bacterium]